MAVVESPEAAVDLLVDILVYSLLVAFVVILCAAAWRGNSPATPEDDDV